MWSDHETYLHGFRAIELQGLGSGLGGWGEILRMIFLFV